MKRVKEKLYEKFEESSDPIEDLNIGIQQYIKNCYENIENLLESIECNEYLSNYDMWIINGWKRILRGIIIDPNRKIIKFLFYVNKFRYCDSGKLINKITYSENLLKQIKIFDIVEFPPIVKMIDVSDAISPHTCIEVMFNVKSVYAKYLPSVNKIY